MNQVLVNLRKQKVVLEIVSKKFYWLKLKNTFFNQKEIKLLRRIAGGDTYTIIYLKMMLLSLDNEGTIYFDSVADSFEEELSLELDEDVENVQVTLSFLKTKGLLEIKNEDEFFLNEVPTIIGKETDSAERVRRYRRKQKESQISQSNDLTLQSNYEVTKGNTEKEKESDKERKLSNSNIGNVIVTENNATELDQDNNSRAEEKIPYKEIIDYLNEKAERGFKPVEKHKSLIKSRWNEGQRLDDFKKVVDIKVKHAKDSTNFFDGKYLQPSTLFGNKFDEYLNQHFAEHSVKKTSTSGISIPYLDEKGVYE